MWPSFVDGVLRMSGGDRAEVSASDPIVYAVPLLEAETPKLLTESRQESEGTDRSYFFCVCGHVNVLNDCKKM